MGGSGLPSGRHRLQACTTLSLPSSSRPRMSPESCSSPIFQIHEWLCCGVSRFWPGPRLLMTMQQPPTSFSPACGTTGTGGTAGAPPWPVCDIDTRDGRDIQLDGAQKKRKSRRNNAAQGALLQRHAAPAASLDKSRRSPPALGRSRAALRPALPPVPKVHPKAVRRAERAACLTRAVAPPWPPQRQGQRQPPHSRSSQKRQNKNFSLPQPSACITSRFDHAQSAARPSSAPRSGAAARRVRADSSAKLSRLGSSMRTSGFSFRSDNDAGRAKCLSDSRG